MGDEPEAVDLETAVALVEAAPSDDTDDSSAVEPVDGSADPALTTQPTGDAGTTSSTGPDISVTTSNAAPATQPSEDIGTTSSTGPDASTATSNTAATDDSPSTDTVPDTETASVNAEAGALAGVWTVVSAEGADDLTGEAAASFAGYRVVEVLAGGVDESTVVGRTAEVTGSIELTGTALVAATLEVEIATLRTDESHRDSHMRAALNTKEFPLAVFTLVEPVELPVGVSEGERFSGSAVGDLTIKGVTNRVGFDLEAQLVGDTIVVVGSTEVIFSDYGVTTPTSAAVISVEDHGIMEFQLFFTR